MARAKRIWLATRSTIANRPCPRLSLLTSSTSATPARKGKGASAAKKTAEKSKLQAEIVMLKQQIKQAKQGMGVAIYDALSLANEAEVQRVFESAKGRVDELEAKITEKNGRIEELGYK